MIEQLHALSSTVALGVLVFMAVPLAMTVARLLIGPTYADRFVALDMLTGVAAAIGALTCAVTGRREFVDVALGLALFGFIGTCAMAAFLERKGVRS